MPRPWKLKVAPPRPHEDLGTPSTTPQITQDLGTPQITPRQASTGNGSDYEQATEEQEKQDRNGTTCENAIHLEQLEEEQNEDIQQQADEHRRPSKESSSSYRGSGRHSRVSDIPDGEEEAEIIVNPLREDCKCFMVLLLWIVFLSVGLTVLFVAKDNFDQPECIDESADSSVYVEPPEKCEVCGKGTWVIPLGGDMEQNWNAELRAVLYFLGLMWVFLGIAIVCDQFMAAIEEVTSRTRAIWAEGAGHSRHKVHLRVWNDTMANLTLMALGSSAPEILLNLLELIGNDFFSGQLGPSTIVGSAAFNLLVITAVCIGSLQPPRVLKVVRTEVFAITAIFSILAYFWLIVTLGMITPDKVDIWEALVTLGLFPVLLVISFVADKGWIAHLRCSRSSRDSSSQQQEEIKDMQEDLKRKFGKSVSFDNVKMLLEANQGGSSMPFGKTMSLKAPRLTRAQHRRSVMRSFTGHRQSVTMGGKTDVVAFGFAEQKYVVLECAGEVILNVLASKSIPDNTSVAVRYKTSDIDAAAGERYESVEGWLRFEAGEREKAVCVPIIDNDTWEPTQMFCCQLTDIAVIMETDEKRDNEDTGKPRQQKVRPKDGKFILKNAVTRVAILNDDEPGTLSFRSSEVTPIKNAPSITLVIDRRDGVCGDIRCHYEARDGSAVQGFDYDYIEGELFFNAGQDRQTLKVPIIQTQPHPDDRSFYIVLNDPTEGVLFDPDTSGGAKSAICEIILAGEPNAFHSVLRLFTKCFNKRRGLLVLAHWRDQFTTAVYVGGCREEQARAGVFEWFFHVMSIFWKLLFATIPPPKCFGGWPCFFVALLMIGAVTALVSDLAGLLGCCIGMPEDICAITLVALGTSLPDTFASRSAAMTDDSADNSVGNVTGSNSVNVFLGMGLPWIIGAVYWEIEGRNKDWKGHFYKGQTFEDRFGGRYHKGGLMVPAESLALSVTVFTCTAAFCLGLLLWRRLRYGGELGGPKHAQWRDMSLLTALWFVYIGASIVISLANK